MDYSEWNAVIAGYFFNEGRAGEKVFLHVDANLIQELGQGQDAVVDFVSAIKAGPQEFASTGTNLCRKSLRLMGEWRDAGAAGIPPYIAYLASFVLGASVEGLYNNEGYYKRLHRLMGEEATNTPPRNFYDTKALWDDLKQWANEDNQGKFGIVRCEFVGFTPYVNLPRAQIVLSGQERSRLPSLFAEAEVDPNAPPTAAEMLRIALGYGAGRLEAKTLRRLRGQGETEMAGLTVEAILEELRFWDRNFAETSTQTKEFHFLRINLQIIDRLSGRAISRLLVKDAEGFPEDGLILSGPGSTQYNLDGFDGNWSNPLKIASGAEVDSSSIPWETGLRLSQGKFTLRLPARTVRLFRRGDFEGVKGLIEINRLDPYQEFYVATSSRTEQQVDEWGRRAGVGWEQVPLRIGLSSGWGLFHARGSNPQILAPHSLPILSSDPSVRIVFEGGLKVKPLGRRYFDFAPPTLRIEGVSPGMAVHLNGVVLTTDSGDICYRFAEKLPAGVFTIEIKQEGEAKYSAAFEIVDSESIPWKQGMPAIGTLGPGNVTEETTSKPCAFGAKVANFNLPPVLISNNVVSDLVGRKVGQVHGIPENGPPEWEPVWLIERGRGRRKVVFCGGDPNTCAPVVDGTADRKQAKEWKNLLWYDRKNLVGPSRGILASLWIQYREIAKNV